VLGVGAPIKSISRVAPGATTSESLGDNITVIDGGRVNQQRDEERRGEAYEGDIKLTVIGTRLHPGDLAPDFLLDALAPGEGVAREVTLAGSAGKVRLLHVVNSLDTPVCHLGAHRFETLRQSDLPPGVEVYTVSMDLPFAQARWRDAEGVTHEALSGHRSEAFGRAYGVLLREWRLLERAVFVIDAADRIAYAEYVPDQMAEPNYDAALAAARKAATSA
jgi:thiol peroxidase